MLFPNLASKTICIYQIIVNDLLLRYAMEELVALINL